jgi:hypothetical protein
VQESSAPRPKKALPLSKKIEARFTLLRWESLLRFCSARSAWPRRSSVIPPARINTTASTTPHSTLPVFHDQITFDTITRERVAARVSAQSPDVQYLDVKPAVQAKGLAITNIAEMAFSIEKVTRAPGEFAPSDSPPSRAPPSAIGANEAPGPAGEKSRTDELRADELREGGVDVASAFLRFSGQRSPPRSKGVNPCSQR